MRAKGLVSVIVPTYKRRAELRRALDSIDMQSYDDIEVVIINGDPDTAVDDLSSSAYPTKHIQHSENHGVAKARNDGINRAQGEFIAFLDDDDEWKPSKIKKQVRKFASLGPEYGLVYCGRDWREKNKTVRRHLPEKEGDVYTDLLRNNFIPSETVVIRTQCLDEVENFNTDLKFGEDYDFWLRIARNFKIGHVAESLAINHNDDPDSLNTKYENRYQAEKYFLNEYYSDISGNPGIMASRLNSLGVAARNTNRTSEAIRAFWGEFSYNKNPKAIANLLFTAIQHPINNLVLNIRSCEVHC